MIVIFSESSEFSLLSLKLAVLLNNACLTAKRFWLPRVVARRQRIGSQICTMRMITICQRNLGGGHLVKPGLSTMQQNSAQIISCQVYLCSERTCQLE